MAQIIEQYRDDILRIVAKYGAHNLRVFGSMIRDDATDTSDFDFRIDLEPNRSLLDHVGFKQELEELLGRNVDIVVEGGISPYLEEHIHSEAIPL